MADIVVNSGAVRNILIDELTNLANAIKRNHKQAGQVASGRTSRSIRAEVLTASGTMAEGVVWGRFPFGTLETGRKAGRVPQNFEAIILQWMKDKGIHGDMDGHTTQEKADLSAAGAIAHVIAQGSKKHPRGGTRLYREGGRNDIYSNVIPDTLERINERIGVLFSEEIETITINS